MTRNGRRDLTLANGRWTTFRHASGAGSILMYLRAVRESAAGLRRYTRLGWRCKTISARLWWRRRRREFAMSTTTTVGLDRHLGTSVTHSVHDAVGGATRSGARNTARRIVIIILATFHIVKLMAVRLHVWHIDIDISRNREHPIRRIFSRQWQRRCLGQFVRRRKRYTARTRRSPLRGRAALPHLQAGTMRMTHTRPRRWARPATSARRVILLIEGVKPVLFKIRRVWNVPKP